MTPNISNVDLCIIGAGPAGMAAALEATNKGLSVALLDEAPRPGGQIYRNVQRTTPALSAILGPDYVHGAQLADQFTAGAAAYLPQAVVWHIEATEPGYRLSYSLNGASHTLDAKSVIAATGALERPMPLPGWTLPGVTTAGALQILLKSSGTVSDDLVLVGHGPLLLLLAAQLVAAGYPPRAIVETVPMAKYWKALPHLPAALRGWRYLLKGAAMLGKIRKAGVPFYGDASDITLEGEAHLTAVSFTAGGKRQTLETSNAGLHHGVVPNQQVSRLMRCAHRWHPSQHAFVPVLDAYGETSNLDFYVAGDGGSIRGARSAEWAGRLTALRIAQKSGIAVPQKDINHFQRKLNEDAAARPFLETLYAPAAQALSPNDNTMICRCEEVTAGQIRRAVADNAPGPNQVKSFLRTGMGPCQGRMCGLAVTALVVEGTGRTPDEVGYYRIRPPLKPLALSELAEYEPAAE